MKDVLFGLDSNPEAIYSWDLVEDLIRWFGIDGLWDWDSAGIFLNAIDVAEKDGWITYEEFTRAIRVSSLSFKVFNEFS